jgi:hypothetical protein
LGGSVCVVAGPDSLANAHVAITPPSSEPHHGDRGILLVVSVQDEDAAHGPFTVGLAGRFGPQTLVWRSLLHGKGNGPSR